jgi:hypothetical protein
MVTAGRPLSVLVVQVLTPEAQTRVDVGRLTLNFRTLAFAQVS